MSVSVMFERFRCLFMVFGWERVEWGLVVCDVF